MRLGSRLRMLLLLFAVAVPAAWATDDVVVEDWSSHSAGATGIPAGWHGQNWGTPRYDFAIAEADGRKALRLRAQDDSSTITKEIRPPFNLKATPILEWSWRVTELPKGGDARRKAKDDQAGQVFVVWPRFPEALRSRIIGYIWDTTAPAGTIVRSEKTSTVTYVVVRSGPADLGKWFTDRRNVREDYRKIYGEEPEPPSAVSLSVDANDTHTSAEWFAGAILFKRP
jgi:hypothetical protein